MMFGRVRPPSSSPDSLERGPSKISKNDHLSVYEATLVKLKRGSELDLSPQSDDVDIDCGSSTYPLSSSEDTTDTIPKIIAKSCLLKCSLGVSQHNKDEMMIDTDCSSVSGCSDSQSTRSPNEEERNVSVIYMFSKFESSRCALSLSNEAMELEPDDSSSASSLHLSSLKSMEDGSKQHCFTSFPS